MLQNARFTSSTISELLKENQQGEKKYPRTHPDKGWGTTLIFKSFLTGVCCKSCSSAYRITDQTSFFFHMVRIFYSY